MTIPYHGTTGDGTYFITASTWEKQGLLQSERMAELFMDVLFHYQKQGKYHLHEFVVMPHHFHALLTPLFSGDSGKSRPVHQRRILLPGQERIRLSGRNLADQLL